MFIFPSFAPVALGKFQREALLRERDELWGRRHRLSEADGIRLDLLLSRVGYPEGYAEAEVQRLLKGEQACK